MAAFGPRLKQREPGETHPCWFPVSFLVPVSSGQEVAAFRPTFHKIEPIMSLCYSLAFRSMLDAANGKPRVHIMVVGTHFTEGLVEQFPVLLLGLSTLPQVRPRCTPLLPVVRAHHRCTPFLPVVKVQIASLMTSLGKVACIQREPGIKGNPGIQAIPGNQGNSVALGNSDI